jgi:CheY-like chemotaxis protein
MGARILVADDSVTIQKVVELTFSKEDFVLEQARNGDETIRKAKETRPDLVLLDLVMPDMNGYDVCAALRNDPALRSVPVILLAGTFESFDHQRAAQVGANDFVTKPFESQVLVGKVKQLLFAKAMEAKGVGTAARLAAGAVTVTISSAAAAARVAAPRPPEAAPPAERPSAPATPPAPEPEELWTLLGEPSAPATAVAQPAERVDASPGEVSAPSAVPAAPPEDTFDLGTPDLEPLPGEVVPAAEGTDDLPLPESLSLDDLLAAGAASAAAALPAEPLSAEAVSTEPVFELSDASASLLPMVEAGTGEPPTLSVDDLLLPTGDEAAPDDTLTMELPEFDLMPLPGADASAVTDLDSAPPTVPLEEAVIGERSLQDAGEPVREALEPEPVAAAAPFELFSSPQLLEEPSELPEPCAVEAATETLESQVADLVVEPPAAVPLVAPVAEQPVPVAPAVVIPSEMAAMREAVTERVASELKRELSEKLLDRFEKIVWEVVPDLAEILITKEIERIRRLAEEEKTS